MKPITAYEYEEIEFPSKIPSKLVDEFKKINKEYSKNKNEKRAIFDIYGTQIKAKQFVGIIKIGKYTIQILPKLLSPNKNINLKENSKKIIEEEVKENNKYIISNLLYMLKYTKKLDLKETDLATLKKHDDLFEVIIYLFAKNLLERLKLDLVKNYEPREENLNFLKGKINFTKHIKHNLVNKAKFYSEYDDFTENNLLNQIFKATIVKLLKITKSTENYKLLSTCNLILIDVPSKRIIYKDFQKVKLTRFTEKYRPSFDLAKLLLFGNSVELSSKDISTFSILFDMNKLFEEFIYEFMKKEFSQEDLENNKIIDITSQSKKDNEVVFKENNNLSNFSLKPDIIIEFDKNSKEINNNKLIIDTKYKILKKDKKNLGVSNSDIYQMLAYGLRFFKDNNQNNKPFNNYKRIILLYPNPDKKKVIKEKVISGYGITEENIKIQVKTVNLGLNLKKDKNKLKKELLEIIKGS